MVVFNASKYILTGTTPHATKSSALALLLSNGFIHPHGKGLYSLLPLGQRVVQKLSQLVDNELDSIGAMKVSMPIVAPKELWEKTGRWQSMGNELLKLTDRTGSELCLQPTAEEMCTQIVGQLPQFKKSALPLMLYQTTEKFRDEMNPRFGLMRGRQFLMKDLYSFDSNSHAAAETYELVSKTYESILKERLQLEVFKVRADSGVHGGKLSHEYHLKNVLEEDGIHFCYKCETGCKRDEVASMPQCPRCESSSSDHATFSTIEVAHTFQLGSKYSEAFAAKMGGHPFEMCCFGIGVTRLLPASVEALSPSRDIIRLPRAIAPFDAAVIVNKALQTNVLVQYTLSTLNQRLKGGILLDDRVDQNVGKRLNQLNRLGIPRVIVIGKSTEDTLNSATSDPKMEYLTAEALQDDLQKRGDFTLNELIQVIDS